MDLDIWQSNPVVEMPLAVGAPVIALIALMSLWRVRFGVFFLVATVPMQRFVVIPGILGDRFTPHEVAFLSVIAAALIRGRQGIKLTAPWSGPIAAPLLFLLAVGVMSLLGNPFLEQGIAEVIILAYLYLLAHILVDFAATPEDAFFLFRSWYITGAAFSALALYGGVMHLLGIQTFLMFGPRLIGTFFNANQAGSFIIATAFLFLARAVQSSTPRAKKLLNLALLFASIVGAYFTASRATVLGGAAGLLVFLVLRRVRVSAIIAIAAMLLAGRFSLGAFQRSDEGAAEIYSQRYSEGVDPDSQSAQVRLDNWQTGIKAFADSPLVGIGIGTLWLLGQTSTGESYQVHNTYLSFLGETGILGFLALMVIIVILVRECAIGIRHARGTPYEDALFAAIPALAALAVFNIFHYGIRARHLWVTMALILAFRRLASHGWPVQQAVAPAAPALKLATGRPTAPVFLPAPRRWR